MNASNQPIFDREKASNKASKDLTKDASNNAKYIRYESFGTDSNKKKKNEDGCNRGKTSGAARYCSKHLRSIYPAQLLDDDEMSEFCVDGRTPNYPNNPCLLCSIDVDHYHGPKTEMVNLSKAILTALQRHNTGNNLLMSGAITNDYPGTKKQWTSLRITVNGRIWFEYYLKLSPHSSVLKTITPSGYKYKDRISVGRMIKIQGRYYKNDLVFYLTKDPTYDDAEREEQRPVVNCVGFWNLLKKAKRGDIRNIIHLNQEQAANVCFGFLLLNPQNIDTIKVEFVTTRPLFNIEDKVIELWSYSRSNHISSEEEKGAETAASDNNHRGLSHVPLTDINGSPSSFHSIGTESLSPSIPHTTHTNNTQHQPQPSSHNIHSYSVSNAHCNPYPVQQQRSNQQPMNVMQSNIPIVPGHNPHSMQNYHDAATTNIHHHQSHSFLNDIPRINGFPPLQPPPIPYLQNQNTHGMPPQFNAATMMNGVPSLPPIVNIHPHIPAHSVYENEHKLNESPSSFSSTATTSVQPPPKPPAPKQTDNSSIFAPSINNHHNFGHTTNVNEEQKEAMNRTSIQPPLMPQAQTPSFVYNQNVNRYEQDVLINQSETSQFPNMTPLDETQSIISGYGGYHHHGLDVSLLRHSPYPPSMNTFLFNHNLN